MRFSIRALFSLAIILPLSGGCTQTSTSIESAKQLEVKIVAYKTQQQQRVDRFNSEYNDRANQLFDDLTTLSDKQLQQGRDSDVQNLTDLLTASDDATLVGRLRTSFSTNLANERQAIASTDEAISAARAAYTKAYKDAQLEFSLLKDVEDDLTLLASNESNTQMLGNALGIAKEVVQTHQDVVKNVQTQRATRGSGNAQSQ